MDRVAPEMTSDRDRLAFLWSVQVTSAVWSARGRTVDQEDPPPEFWALHQRLFPMGQPGLRVAHDGWIAAGFKPITFSDLGQAGFIPTIYRDGEEHPLRTDQPLPTTLQLAVRLGWDRATDLDPRRVAEPIRQRSTAVTTPPKSFTAVEKMDFKALTALAERWTKMRKRSAKACRELEHRISGELAALPESSKIGTSSDLISGSEQNAQRARNACKCQDFAPS